MPHLLQISDVYALDLLGEPGKSVQERPIASYADQAIWLEQTLAALSEERFHPVGISFGGWSVMHDVPTVMATAKRTLGEESVTVYPDASHAINGE